MGDADPAAPPPPPPTNHTGLTYVPWEIVLEFEFQMEAKGLELLPQVEAYVERKSALKIRKTRLKASKRELTELKKENKSLKAALKLLQARKGLDRRSATTAEVSKHKVTVVPGEPAPNPMPDGGNIAEGNKKTQTRAEATSSWTSRLRPRKPKRRSSM